MYTMIGSTWAIKSKACAFIFVLLSASVTTDSDKRRSVPIEEDADTGVARIKEAEEDGKSCSALYRAGVEAYLENRFEDCIAFLERALEKYKLYKKETRRCRINCNDQVAELQPLYPVDVENYHFYEKTVRNTFCILKCMKDRKGAFELFNVDAATEKLFVDAKPYEYLHICYFQAKRMQAAACAAFTYLIKNPEDKVMIKNLKYYAGLPEINLNQIENYEAKDYVYLFVSGMEEYQKENWKSVVKLMESSLKSYLQSDRECRSDCEGPFDQGWYPDMIPSIANHFTYSLRCKSKCALMLNNLNGEKREDLLASHYHYLQFAYYKLSQLRESCESTSTYLLFFPDDETMLENLEYYRNMEGFREDFLKPRQEAVDYMQRKRYEDKLLNFIDNYFKPLQEGFQTDRSNEGATMESNPELEVQQPRKESKNEEVVNRLMKDDLVNRDECDSLINIIKTFPLIGEGYTGNKSPHTKLETFRGITLSRAALLVQSGLLGAKSLELYLRVTDMIRREVEKFFNLKDLYFSYTQIVCRAALPSSLPNRTDFSHAVHSDNCNLKPNGDCEKAPPSFIWRDYSAILYLNNNFEGGEFFFSSDFYGRHVQSEIEPKCGRLVGFSSGKENLHGVRAVKKGTRCALGVWFTLDEAHAEKERIHAYEIIDVVKNRSAPT